MEQTTPKIITNTQTKQPKQTKNIHTHRAQTHTQQKQMKTYTQQITKTNEHMFCVFSL